jgi:hypothetical protein
MFLTVVGAGALLVAVVDAPLLVGFVEQGFVRSAPEAKAPSTPFRHLRVGFLRGTEGWLSLGDPATTAGGHTRLPDQVRWTVASSGRRPRSFVGGCPPYISSSSSKGVVRMDEAVHLAPRGTPSWRFDVSEVVGGGAYRPLVVVSGAAHGDPDGWAVSQVRPPTPPEVVEPFSAVLKQSDYCAPDERDSLQGAGLRGN